MSDLIDRIKGLRYVHVPQASQLFEEAIAEIERLRLTDAEREAIENAAEWAGQDGMEQEAAILRGLLSRCATGHQDGRPKS